MRRDYVILTSFWHQMPAGGTVFLFQKSSNKIYFLNNNTVTTPLPLFFNELMLFVDVPSFVSYIAVFQKLQPWYLQVTSVTLLIYA